MGALASAGVGDSAASSLPGEGVVGSSHSQESLVLDDSVPVASSSSPGCDCQSRLRGRGNSTRNRSSSRSSCLSPLGVRILVRGIAVPALGLEVIVPCLGSCALAPLTVCGRVDDSSLAVTLCDRLLPVCGLVAPGLLTATGIDECARALGVAACGLDDCACD